MVNLSTGEVTRLYSRIRPSRGGSINIHDVDRIAPSTYLVAEIAHPDGVYIVNTTTGIREWYWPVQASYNHSSGGSFPGDWTHLNDVEILDDGRIMVSLRNQDQVVFINRSTGVQSEWTLGSDGEHEILYEQHNPDYIPQKRGGPAVVIADSENRRVIEYQHRNDKWEQTWVWQDGTMQWPRDADRLPNGHTLIADTNANRVIELNQTGDIVWSMSFSGPYDVERLGTGPESAGGQAAVAENLQSQTAPPKVSDDRGISPIMFIASIILQVIPGIVVNGLLYMLPPWVSRLGVLAILGQLSVFTVWTATELYWHRYTFRLPITAK